MSGYVRERSGSALPGIAPSNVYACADGEFPDRRRPGHSVRAPVRRDRPPELAGDDHYATHVARGRNQAELDVPIGEWTRGRTVEEVEALMLEHSIPAGRIYRAPEMLEDPHFAAREALVDVPHSRWKGLKMQNVFPKLSRTPGAIRSIAPQTVGQDNAAIYGELGLSDEDIAGLIERQVI